MAMARVSARPAETSCRLLQMRKVEQQTPIGSEQYVSMSQLTSCFPRLSAVACNMPDMFRSAYHPGQGHVTPRTELGTKRF